MPWSSKDAVHKSKKAGRSPRARKQWAKVANAVLARTGDDGMAIRQANAVVAKRKKRRT